jgi:AcrR family transcriptional regulator
LPDRQPRPEDEEPAVAHAGLSRKGPAESGRLEVLEAAATVFADRGFMATTVDDIADVLGSTKGRIYHYYRSKSDIFVDLLVLAMDDLLSQVRPIQEKIDLPADERLLEAARMHARVIMTQSARSRVAVQGTETWLMQDAAAKQREALRYFVQLRDEYEQCFADLIAEGVAEGTFREIDPRTATKPIFGALNWINMWYRPRGTDAVEPLADEFATFCVNGLRRALVSDNGNTQVGQLGEEGPGSESCR